MSTIAIRIKSKSGVENIRNLDVNSNIKAFQTLISEKTGIASTNQKILYGYPPKVLDVSNQELSINGIITNGDALTIEELVNNTSSINQNSSTSSSSSQTQHSNNTATTNNNFEKTKPTTSTQTASPDGVVMRRLTENDNSCLFSAVGYVLENKNRSRASRLRQIIVDVVKKDQFTYNEGFLGKDNADYCKWITDSRHWGGAIELSILSQHYKVEIGAFDIATKILYCYGEDQGHKDRVYVIYDGIHYDALSICLVDNGPEDYDVTIFDAKDETTLKKMKAFVESENKAGKFTDTANFQLLCLECNKILVGEKEAALHASQTRHSKFTEKKNR